MKNDGHAEYVETCGKDNYIYSVKSQNTKLYAHYDYNQMTCLWKKDQNECLFIK